MGHPKDAENLTDRQRAFTIAYIGEAGYNATLAAKIAGYAQPAQSGWECCRNPHIRAAIDKHLEEINQVGLAQKQVRIARLNEMWDKLDRYEKSESKKMSIRDIYSEKRQIMAQVRAEVGDDIQQLHVTGSLSNVDGAKDKLAELLNLPHKSNDNDAVISDM